MFPSLPLLYYIRCNPSRCFLLFLSSITLDGAHHDVSFSSLSSITLDVTRHDVSSDLSYLYYITMFPHISLSSITSDVTHHDVSSDLPLFYYIRCNPSRCFLLSLSSITLDVTHHDVSFSPSPLLH